MSSLSTSPQGIASSTASATSSSIARSSETADGETSTDLKALKRYHFVTESVMLIKLTIFRSGYTGEDGVEIILPAKAATMAMKLIGGKLDMSNLRSSGRFERATNDPLCSSWTGFLASSSAAVR